MKRKMTWFAILVILVVVVLGAGCATGDNAIQAENPQESVELGTSEKPDSTLTPAEADPVEMEATEAAPNNKAEDITALKQGLEATDPDGVSLTSGEIQLIEFFAFW